MKIPPITLRFTHTNSGININYKTDGVVPQDDATTEIAPPTINFDDDSKWVAGSASLTSYASDHQYSDKIGFSLVDLV